MATSDPIQAVLGTDTGSDLKDKLTQNFRDRFAAEAKTVNNAADPYTVLPDDEHLQVDASGGVVTLNLELISAAAEGRTLFIEAVDAGSTITLDPSGAETINGAATKTIGTVGRCVVLRSDGTEWRAWYMDLLP